MCSSPDWATQRVQDQTKLQSKNLHHKTGARKTAQQVSCATTSEDSSSIPGTYMVDEKN